MSETTQHIVLYVDEKKEDGQSQSDVYIDLLSNLYLFNKELYDSYVNTITRVYRNTEQIREYIEINVRKDRKSDSVVWNFNSSNLSEIQSMIIEIETTLFSMLMTIESTTCRHEQLVQNVKRKIDDYDFTYYTSVAYDEWSNRFDETRMFNRINIQRTLYEKRLQHTKKVKEITPKKKLWNWNFDLFGESFDFEYRY